jgi:hypothetical protein
MAPFRKGFAFEITIGCDDADAQVVRGTATCRV